MKSGRYIVAGAAAVTIGCVVFAFLRESSTAPLPGTADQTDALASQSIHVDELTANPNDYTGRVLIRGIVAGINHEEGVVALIDLREFEECGTVACAKNYLPVRVDGTLPEPLSLIQVVGEITRGTNGLEVRAESVEGVK